MPKIVGNYKLLRTIGKGTFSKVKEVIELDTGKIYAMKIIQLSDIHESGKEDEIKRRIGILAKLNHPSIINIHSWMHSDDKVFLVFDYVDNLLIKKISDSWPLSEKTARKYFQQLIDVLNYIHNHGATFRDLSLENIFVDFKDNVYLSDFIFSNIPNKRLIQESHDSVASYFLRYYVAPEVQNTDGYVSPSADIYSAGVILYHMLFGALPFESSHPEELENNKRNGISSFPSGVSFDRTNESHLKKLIKIMLSPEPHNRPSIAEIKKNVWFKEDYREIRGNETRKTNIIKDIQTTVTYSANTTKSTASLNDEINGFELISRISQVKLDRAVGVNVNSNGFDTEATVDSPTSFTVPKSPFDVINSVDKLLKDYQAWVCNTKTKERTRKAIIPVCSKKYQIAITVSKIGDELTLVEVDRITGDVLGFLEVYQKIKTHLNKM